MGYLYKRLPILVDVRCVKNENCSMLRTLRNILIGFLIAALIVFAILTAAIADFPLAPPERRGISKLVGNRNYNFAIWEFDALRAKLASGLINAPSYLSEAGNQQIVLDYVETVATVRRIDFELGVIFAEATDPESASRDLQNELKLKRAELERLQPVAEAVLQVQVAQALNDEGFGVFGRTWPPVEGRMTPLPLMLIVSPRDNIQQEFAFALIHGMPAPERDLLERQIFEQYDRAALVVPIGGLGIFPAMIIESGNLNFLANTYAHEWVHHFLSLNPLGVRYAQSPQLRTMNETTASIVGTEIGRTVIERHYPVLPQPPPMPVQNKDDDDETVVEIPTPEPIVFDFGTEMNKTRERVDELLANNQIEEAEAYMEERRLLFVENGRSIRKLNQAYFAFYGGYATSPGAQGSDPVGPAVVALRAESPTLFDFVDEIKVLTSFEELEALLASK